MIVKSDKSTATLYNLLCYPTKKGKTFYQSFHFNLMKEEQGLVHTWATDKGHSLPRYCLLLARPDENKPYMVMGKDSWETNDTTHKKPKALAIRILGDDPSTECELFHVGEYKKFYAWKYVKQNGKKFNGSEFRGAWVNVHDETIADAFDEVPKIQEYAEDLDKWKLVDSGITDPNSESKLYHIVHKMSGQYLEMRETPRKGLRLGTPDGQVNKLWMLDVIV